MVIRSISFIAAVAFAIATLAIAPASAGAQEPPDLRGLWEPNRSADIAELMKEQGQEIPFTAHGAERYKNVDYAKNPNGFCLPPGPSRALTGGSLFYIVQDTQAVGLFIENHGVFRVIYMDGRGHPEDIADYPTFMGHSIGKWEGDALVVDTIGLNDRTWLDSNGLEHSEKLHLTERFQKAGPDLIKYSVTYEDPVFYTRPWTMTIDIKKVTSTRLIEYVCLDNEKDQEELVPTPRQ